MNQKSIIDMAHGAFKERADYEMAKILENILDPNTKAEKKRTLTIKMVFVPDSERQTVQVEVTAKSKLEPTSAVKTSLYITGDQDGQATAIEMVPQIPGQQYLDGGEQEAPAALRLIQA